MLKATAKGEQASLVMPADLMSQVLFLFELHYEIHQLSNRKPYLNE